MTPLKKLSFLITFIFFSPVSSQDLDDNSNFGSPGQLESVDQDEECRLSKDFELIQLLNLKLKKFNPTSKEFEQGPPLTDGEIKHKAIRYYSLQLKDQRNVKIDINVNLVATKSY